MHTNWTEFTPLGHTRRYRRYAPWWLGPWPAPHNGVAPILAANVIAAYQPKGAGGVYYTRAVANYAASLINLNNPGTNDAITGVAPLWAEATGWTGTGTQWINTNVAGGASQDQSLFIAFSNATGLTCVVCGSGSGIQDALQIIPRHITGAIIFANCSNTVSSPSPPYSDGIMGFTNRLIFINGVQQMFVIPAFGNANALNVYILAFNFSGAAVNISSATIGCFVRYGVTITPAQAAAVSWAMGQIRSA